MDGLHDCRYGISRGTQVIDVSHTSKDIKTGMNDRLRLTYRWKADDSKSRRSRHDHPGNVGAGVSR
jgi:hypothetical protein